MFVPAQSVSAYALGSYVLAGSGLDLLGADEIGADVRDDPALLFAIHVAFAAHSWTYLNVTFALLFPERLSASQLEWRVEIVPFGTR
jgi:hypothetical protein